MKMSMTIGRRSYSLQFLVDSKHVFLLIFIISISSCSALQIGISPAKINLSGFVGEDICSSVEIKSDYYGNLNGDIRFGKNMNIENNINNFNIEPEKIGIRVEYPKTLRIEKDTRDIKICLNSDREIETKGVLLYYPDEGYAGVGSLIFATIRENILKKQVITGLFIMQGFLIGDLLIILVVGRKLKKFSE